MTTANSTADLARLMAKDDLTTEELARLLSYVPTEKLPALAEQILAGIGALQACA